MEPIVITDAASGSTARIAPQLGFNCFEFKSVPPSGPEVDVIDCEPGFVEGNGRYSANGIPLLFPFPNRIREGRFTWEGHEYHLPEGEVGYNNGNAIHGFCLDRAWRITEQTESSATGEFQLSVDAPERADLWPADFIIRVKYTVSGAALVCDVEVTNPDSRPLPWGFGTHAYFKLPLSPSGDAKQCLVEAPAHKQWELVECMPTGACNPVGESADLREGAYFDTLQLDDVLGGLVAQNGQIETAVYDESAGLKLIQRFSDDFRELVVFTPPWTTAVCMEPYTCVTDAINLEASGTDAGWRVLQAGQSWSTCIEITTEQIMA